MISLLKFLDLPWDQARGYLREDLDHLEAALNQRWAALAGDSNVINVATTVTGTLAVGHGGTGVTSFTAHGVILGNGTSALSVTAAGTTNNALIGVTGADPVYGKIGLTTHISGVLPIANGGTNATSFTNTRIPFFDGTRLVDDADLTFVTDTLTATKIVGATSITDTGLTATRVVFAGTAGLLSDDADLTFVTDTLTATKLVAPTSASTPSLISTAALTVTPAAGSNLNVVLSTTGDFAVNTSQLYVDTSTAFVGIGTATPGTLLTVEKDGLATTGADGLVLQNLTAATVGTTVQTSPRLRFRCNVWNTTATAATNTQDWFIEARPTSGGNPTGVLRVGTSFNGGTERVNVFQIQASSLNAGDIKTVTLNHDDNTSGTSSARFIAAVGGSSGGDPSFQFGISGGVNWSVGLDNSDSDNFKIGANSAVGTSTALTIDQTLRVGIGVTSPTAFLHLLAGTATANTAPLKFNSGTILATAEAGAIEFNTDDFFATITTGAARKAFILDNGARLTSGKMPIATTNGRLIDLTASSAYTPTNVTTDRSYDANATTLDEISDVLGTLIADLQTKGILG